MALALSVLCPPPPCGFCRGGVPERRRRAAPAFLAPAGSLVCAGNGGVDRVLKRAFDGGLSRGECRVVVVRGRLKLSDSPAVENGQIRSSVEIPVTCYQIIGVSEKAEKDEVVKTVMELKSSEIEDGYTMDVILSRQDLLMDVRDKLLFEPEFAGNIKEKVPPKASLHIPWSRLPAALCLLQEVGEDKLVLEIGRVALQHQDSKSYAHDLVLSMALAECSIAKVAFEKNKVSQGFEALARAQYLLRSKTSLEKMPLLSQIEESLEELAPACTLELLSMPQTPDNGERRRGAISALQELLRQGLEVETSCRVQDWPCFLSHALNRLLAAEIVDLLSWDTLATTRKNKKSLESQNQRIVIDFNCFYVVMIAHIALGFSTRQRDLVSKAKTICECLVASEGINLKFEEALCSLLLGQVFEKAALEKLHQLQTNGSPVLHNMELASLNKVPDGKTGIHQSVEIWLKDSVLGVFPDARDCSPSLDNYFAGQKRLLSGVNYHKGPAKAIPDMGRRSSTWLSLERKSMEDTTTHVNSMRHLGEAVKQLAPANIENELVVDKISNNTGKPSMQPETNDDAMHQKGIWQCWWVTGNTPATIAYVALMGCIVFFTLKLFSTKIVQTRTPSRLTAASTAGQTRTSSSISTSYSDLKVGPDSADSNNIVLRLGKLFKMSKKQLKHPTNVGNVDNSCSPRKYSNLPLTSASIADMNPKRQMPLEEAEALLRKWQVAKAEALGPDHQIEILSDVLAETMLSQWKALANSAKLKPCFWRFVLLQLSILRSDIIPDGVGGEMAEIEAVLEEAAELVDGSLSKNPNYYSTYKILYMLKKGCDGSWRFCEGGIQQESP